MTFSNLRSLSSIHATSSLSPSKNRTRGKRKDSVVVEALAATNRRERRKRERERQTCGVDKEEEELREENVPQKLQKPRTRKVKEEIYNDVVTSMREKAAKERETYVATATSEENNNPRTERIRSDGLVIPSREDVVGSCTGTSTLILMLGLGARFIVPRLAEVNPLMFGMIKEGINPGHACLASALAIAVTFGRVIFMSYSEDFAKETNDSNKQVLTNLAFLDVLFCSAYPALAEEMLFRGALMPALGGGTLGVFISGTVFGALHISNERKVSFALWAATVGIFYGATCEYLACGDLAVPICGHALANIYSALYWRFTQAETKLEFK